MNSDPDFQYWDYWDFLNFYYINFSTYIFLGRRGDMLVLHLRASGTAPLAYRTNSTDTSYK